MITVVAGVKKLSGRIDVTSNAVFKHSSYVILICTQQRTIHVRDESAKRLLSRRDFNLALSC